MNYTKLVQLRKNKFTLKSINDVLYKVKNFNMPEKLKGTFFHRWGMYWKNLYIDYKEAAVGVVKDCKEHPVRASIYASLLASCIYLNKHNPDETSFREQLLQNTIKIMQVGEAIRNPVSEHHVKWLGQCYNEGIIRLMNLGIVSLIWLDDYDETCSLYKATCPHLKVQYTKFYHRIVDFGFLDKWWILESKMKDYDVNELEFSKMKHKRNI